MSKLVLATAIFLSLISPAIGETTQEIESRLKVEKKALTQWVVANAHNKITTAKASKIVDYVYRYSAEYDLDPLLVLSVVKTESGFRENAKSTYGATGLMQIVPRYHAKRINGRDPNKINVNLEVGADILAEYLGGSNKNLKKALHKYSGGAKSGYYKKVVINMRSMSKHIVEYSFMNEYNITGSLSVYRVAQAQ